MITQRFYNGMETTNISEGSGTSTNNYFWSITGMIGTGQWSTAEVNANLKLYTASYTFRDQIVHVVTNTATTTYTSTLRVNGADSTSVVSIPGTTTGEFSDTSHTVATAANDLVCYKLNTGAAGAGVIFHVGWGITATNATNVSIMAFVSEGSQPANVTRFFPVATCGLAAGGGLYTAEADANYTLRAGSVTLSKWRVYFGANTSAAATTCDVRVAGVSTALTVSVTATTTGQFEDTTHSGAQNNNAIAYRTVGAGMSTVAFRLDAAQVQYDTSPSYTSAVAPLAVSATIYLNPGQGHYTGATTDADVATTSQIDQTVSDLVLRIASNSSTVARTVTLRQNAASTALTVNIPSSTTGDLSDTTHSVALVASDTFDWEWLVGNAATTGRGSAMFTPAVASVLPPRPIFVNQARQRALTR